VTPGGIQKVATVTEPGLYRLMARSSKPEAKAFDRWVRHEVLPSIRKTGSYQAPATVAPKAGSAHRARTTSWQDWWRSMGSYSRAGDPRPRTYCRAICTHDHNHV